jgi:hypothetical protein
MSPGSLSRPGSIQRYTVVGDAAPGLAALPGQLDGPAARFDHHAEVAPEATAETVPQSHEPLPDVGLAVGRREHRDLDHVRLQALSPGQLAEQQGRSNQLGPRGDGSAEVRQEFVCGFGLPLEQLPDRPDRDVVLVEVVESVPEASVDHHDSLAGQTGQDRADARVRHAGALGDGPGGQVRLRPLQDEDPEDADVAAAPEYVVQGRVESDGTPPSGGSKESDGLLW